MLGAALLAGAAVAAAPATFDRLAAPAQAAEFDFDTGNAIPDVLWGRVSGVVRQIVSAKGNDATLVSRVATLASVAQFDAVAPYTPGWVGIYSRLGRRPASEAATNRNMNIAMLYASYRVYMSTVPQGAETWRTVMSSVGLDPNDDSTDTATAVGIGNTAGAAVIAARAHDGMNQLGDERGRKYNRLPYNDYLGFVPANSPFELTSPSKWQPGVTTRGNGVFTIQKFITPQLKVTKPFSYTSPTEFSVPPPRKSDYEHNSAAYKRQVDEILTISAGLTEEQKLKAEFFDDKFRGIGFSAGNVAVNRKLPLPQFVEHVATSDIGAFDALIVAWHNKWKYNAVRPWSAIRKIYGHRPVTAWGGPGKGTVRDIPADQWQSYLDLPDHPEYPSGSTSMCSAVAQVSRRVFNSDSMELTYHFAKGSSLTEPGVTPAVDRDLSWSNWTDWMRDCGLSRTYGGVHFKGAVEASWSFGQKVGDRAYEFVHRHVVGNAGPVG